MNWEKHFRTVNEKARKSAAKQPMRVEFGGILDGVLPTSQTADNLNSLNDYMHVTATVTPAAANLLSSWVAWWDATGNPSNYTFSVPDSVWDEARNRRLAFDQANVTSQAQLDQVNVVAKTGVSSEQAQGLPDRRDPNTGLYVIPPAPLVPAWVKPVAIGAVAVGLGLSLIPTLRKLILFV